MSSKQLQEQDTKHYDHSGDVNSVASEHEHGPVANAAAAAGESHEHNMSNKDALRIYRPAVIWALLMSMQSIMEGYNISLGSGLIIFEPFAEKYGSYYGPDLGWQLSFGWQMGISLGATAGGIVGAIIAGFMIERIGARWTIMISHTILAGAIFIQFYASSIQMLFAGTLVNGIPWGILASIGSIYSSEIIPTVLRGYFINFTNFAFVAGMLLSAGVLQPFSTNNTEWAYRIPFALQWIWPLPLFLIALFAPESPWWLMRKGEMEKTKHSLQRLTRGLSEEAMDNKIAMMKHTDAFEKEMRTESGYADCFKGANLPRTEVACIALASQGLTGSNLAQSPTYFMRQAGLPNDAVFKMNLGAMAIGLIGNVVCWFLMARVGRRPLFIWGCVGLTISLFLIGILDQVHNSAALWTQSSMCLVWIAIYSSSAAPVTYTIAGEVSATRVRAQTLSLAKVVYGISACAGALIQTYLVNPTGVDIKGKSAYPWFGFSILYIVWAIFRLPETKGRTYEELDVLFENKVSPRKFNKHNVHDIADLRDSK